MMKAIFAIVISMLLLGGSVSELRAQELAENISCPSVASFDLQNTKISTIKLVNGKACTSDGLPEKCDWEHMISKDEILKPAPEKEVRLVVINENHLTGSGAWDTVIVFDCLQGSLRRIFENRYLYGVNIKKNTDGEIIFTSGEWLPNDPMCCPSMKKREIYRWSSDKNTYILASTATSKTN